jgi:hypothetical protein
MSDPNEVVRVLEAIKRLSPEHRQRAESVAVVVEQALASAQTTIAALERRIAELEARPVASAGLIEAVTQARNILEGLPNLKGDAFTACRILTDALRAADRSAK